MYHIIDVMAEFLWLVSSDPHFSPPALETKFNRFPLMMTLPVCFVSMLFKFM